MTKLPKTKNTIATICIFLGVICVFMAFGAFTCRAENVYYDALERKVVLSQRPERIVSLAPSITEILYFLGAGERIVGVTEYSYYPPEAQKKPKVGSYININMEKVLNLRPDLVIATKDGNPPSVVEMLEAFRIPVYVINPRTLKGIIETIADLALVIEAEDQAKEKIASLNNKLQTLKLKGERIHHKKVFLQINTKPIITVGKNTLHHDIIQTAGGINIFGDSIVPYPRTSVEEVIKRAPDVILISSMEGSGHFEEAKREWMRWKNIPAVGSKRIFMIDSDLIDRPTPRAFLGLENVFLLLSQVE